MKSLFEKEEKETQINQLKVDLISRFYPFSKAELIKYQTILSFGYSELMKNNQISWNMDLLDQLSEKIDWSAIHKINGMSLDFDFFKKFEGKIDFMSIHFSKNITWSSDLLETYGSKFDWSKTLITKEPLSTLENLRRFKDQLNWKLVSERIKIDFNDTNLDEFADKWDWQKLSSNVNLPLSVEFIQKHRDYLDFDALSQNPVSLDLIYKYPTSQRWNWDKVILNPGITYNRVIFNFVFAHYKKYYEAKDFKHPYFKKLALDYFLTVLFSFQRNDISFFLKEEFFKYIPWERFCKSCKTKLPFEFIQKHKEKLCFKEPEFVRVHKEIITQEFILENLELFDSEHYSFYYLPINIKILSNLKDKINWQNLSSCEKLNWNWEFIDKNFDKINFYRLSENIGVYENLIRGKLGEKGILEFLDEELKRKI